jgi:phosphatidylserine decarboxylase
MLMPLRTKIEELDQARRIHGGVLGLAAVSLGIRLARVEIPSRALRLLVYRSVFGRKFAALDEAELDRPLADYESFHALFTRAVRPGLRPISEGAADLLAPCDGEIQEVGVLDRDRLLTAKGIDYTLRSLAPGVDARRFEGGRFATVFLSPRDCHRVFSPHEATIEEAIHVPGFRLLVHPPYQRRDFPVYSLNERLILRLATPLGACLLILVAGFGVGNLTLRFDPAFRPRDRRVAAKAYAPAIRAARGEWIATFELGSTVIVVVEPQPNLTPRVVHADKVRYGQPLFSVARDGG